MLFDTHTHINDESITKEEREALIQEIEASDLLYVCDIGFDINSSITAIEHAAKYPWCYATVGIHPEYVDRTKDRDMDTIRELAKSNKVVAIGEIGLDYHYTKEFVREEQYFFLRQLQIALELNLPVSVHSRDADQDTFDILKESGIFSDLRRNSFPDKNPHVVIHCYSGSLEMAREYVKLGAYLGIDGPVTYKNNRKTVEVVRNIPLSNLVIETDAPYLTPVPLRGERNKTTNVKYVAEKIAEIKGLTFEEVSRVTLENGKKLYNIK